MSSEIIVKQGQLEKEGGGALTRWQPRCFILTSSEFSWFKVDDLRTAQGSIAIGEITGTEKQLGERQGRKNVFTVSTGRKSYQLAAPSKEERDDWLLALSPATHAEYAAKAAAGSVGPAAVGKSGEDEVLRRMKEEAKKLAEQKGLQGMDQRRDTQVLIPLTPAAAGSAAKSASTSSAKSVESPSSAAGPAKKAEKTVFAVVEVFVSHGLRISGSVANQMFTMLGQGVSNDRKHLDKRGWYCDKSFNLCSVLQTFMTNGWSLYRVSQSVSFTPWDSALVPINLCVFVRGPGAEELLKPVSRSFDSVSESLPGTLQRGMTLPGGDRRGTLIKEEPGMKLLDGGEDAELQDLMKQFNIPLDLLYLKP